jgi:hypothetical protein
VTVEAEAARYALLRRLAPSMRHHLVVNLQPIGMIYEVMDRRLRAQVPDLDHVRDSAGKINGFARAALTASLDVVGWLAPDESVAITVPEGARECASLLATSLSFRGYALRNEVPAEPGTVRRAAIRCLLAGALMHSTDHTAAPARLVLACEAQRDHACITVEAEPTPGEDQGYGGEPAYRKITWGDLQALAAAEGVRIEREGQRIALHLPWVQARGAASAA